MATVQIQFNQVPNTWVCSSNGTMTSQASYLMKSEGVRQRASLPSLPTKRNMNFQAVGIEVLEILFFP